MSELAACLTSPDVYKVTFGSSSVNELLQTFSDILQDCTFSSVESTLVDYVTSIVEPVGWKAVWRSTKKIGNSGLEYDFVVEVINVSLEKLEADVYVNSVITENANTSVLKTLKKILNPQVLMTVPLIELYTISEDDDDESFVKTANCIEYVRFFLTQLSRPWDGDDDDIMYTEKFLKPRLQLYFDMRNNVLPKTIAVKIQSILKDSWRVYRELNALYTEMNVSDSEAEINEDDLLQSVSLRTKLGELQAKMEMLENPVIRSLVMKKYTPKSRACSKRNPVTYIISKQFTSEMISNLNIEPSFELEFEHNPEIAFKASSSGDKIIILPGTYQCDTLGWLEGDIVVEGFGSCTDIVLEATGNSDVFLNCCSQSIKFENISLKAKSGLLCALLVHHGSVSLKSCQVDCNKSDIGVLLLGGSEAIIENSIICNASEDGIQMRSLSTLKVNSSSIMQCNRHGIQIDVEEEDPNCNFTTLILKNSHILSNGGHGLFMKNVSISEISLQRPSGDFSILEFFPWLKYEIENSVIVKNGQMGVGVSSFCKPIADVTEYTKIYPTCPKDEHNSSVLSDLLNEL